jgi:hypothetical protein
LIVEVEYKPNTTTEEQLRAMLLGSIHSEISNGGLTGETDAEVERWNAYVSRFYRMGDPDAPKEVKKDEKAA